MTKRYSRHIFWKSIIHTIQDRITRQCVLAYSAIFRLLLWNDIYDMMKLGWHAVAVVQHTFTHKQDTEQHNWHKQYIEHNELRVRAVPHLCELYPGICLATEEKARKNLSQGSRRNKNIKRHKTTTGVRSWPLQYNNTLEIYPMKTRKKIFYIRSLDHNRCQYINLK